MKVDVLGLVVVTAGMVLSCQASPQRKPAPRELERRWQLYRSADPAWPDARDEWLAMGEHEREILILNLLADLEAGSGKDWLRPLAELETIGSAVVPYALAALQARRHDAVARHRNREVLGRVADAATLRQAYRDAAEDEGLRIEIVAAMGRCAAPGCTGLLATVLSSDPSWQARSGAAEALAGLDIPPGAPAADSIVAALGDADLFVARKTAEAAAALGLSAATRPLLSLLDRALQVGDKRTAATVYESLRALTHHPEIGDDPGAWKALLERR